MNYTYSQIARHLTSDSARAVFTLDTGDTAWNPDSTCRLIHGPADVVYTRHAEGITAQVQRETVDSCGEKDA